MQVLECQADLCCIKASPVLIEAALHLFQVEEELTAIYKLHDQVQTLIVLKGVLKSHNERMVELLKDLTLDADASHLICLNQQVLQDGLHGKDLLGLVVLDKVDLAVGSATDSSQYSEVALLHI